MRARAVFLDRDGTVNVDQGYVHKTGDFALIDGAVEALKRLRDLGFKLFIVTNQSGIGRGMYKREDYDKFQKLLIGTLRREGISIEETYVCSHSPDDNCDCRKPSPKFVEEAAMKYDIDLEASYVIGDHASDVRLGKNVGATGILVLTGHGRKHEDKGDPDFIAEDILDASEWIEQVEKQKRDGQ